MHSSCHSSGDITAAMTILGMIVVLTLERKVILVSLYDQPSQTRKTKTNTIIKVLMFCRIRQISRDIENAGKALTGNQDDYSREIFARIACFSCWAVVCLGYVFDKIGGLAMSTHAGGFHQFIMYNVPTPIQDQKKHKP